MKKSRSNTINGYEIEEFDWAVGKVVYVNGRLTMDTFEEAIYFAEKAAYHD